ncbi:hypothetical protein D477_015244 [Arthrobacter crystallopoietes BAB-32]|uniref:Uncharacterized protein n=1 Tax=Arthrobacter crystallopoietes BAB-32 TaxID=1246476 RepID=N1V552_9MICC|nr:hypothetical protein [Arthrobacter crystallopoietes]EMY33368.1 hypothetical protein D477_015244 [Arthrobacter crystallopoietes BAB-32]
MSRSWRDGVEPEVLQDIDTLFGTGLGMAQEQLEQHGAFLPAALVMDPDGELRMIAVAPPETGNGEEGGEVDADAMIQDIYAALQQQKTELRAVAVISDIYLPDHDTDAIHVATEHSWGTAIAAIQPYSTDDTGRWLYPDPFIDPQERLVWPPAGNGS